MGGADGADFLDFPTKLLCDPFPISFVSDDVSVENSGWVVCDFRLPSTTNESSLFALISAKKGKAPPAGGAGAGADDENADFVELFEVGVFGVKDGGGGAGGAGTADGTGGAFGAELCGNGGAFGAELCGNGGAFGAELCGNGGALGAELCGNGGALGAAAFGRRGGALGVPSLLSVLPEADGALSITFLSSLLALISLKKGKPPAGNGGAVGAAEFDEADDVGDAIDGGAGGAGGAVALRLPWAVLSDPVGPVGVVTLTLASDPFSGLPQSTGSAGSHELRFVTVCSRNVT